MKRMRVGRRERAFGTVDHRLFSIHFRDKLPCFEVLGSVRVHRPFWKSQMLWCWN
jgi:hypothetical protein